MDSWLSWLRGLGAAARSGVSALVVLAVCLTVAPVAWSLSGWVGLGAAAAAAGCCWLGALAGTAAALVVGRFAEEQTRVAHEFLAAMVLRMGVPLAVALAVHYGDGALAKAGLLYYLLVFYPVTLAAETALSLLPARR